MNGVATLNWVPDDGAGQYMIKATYQGDATFAESSVTVTHTVRSFVPTSFTYLPMGIGSPQNPKQ